MPGFNSLKASSRKTEDEIARQKRDEAAFLAQEDAKAKQQGYGSRQEMHVAQWKQGKEDAKKEAEEKQRREDAFLGPGRWINEALQKGVPSLIDRAFPGFGKFVDPFVRGVTSAMRGDPNERSHSVDHKTGKVTYLTPRKHPEPDPTDPRLHMPSSTSSASSSSSSISSVMPPQPQQITRPPAPPLDKALERIRSLLGKDGSVPAHAFSTQGAGFCPTPVSKIVPKPSMANEIGRPPAPITNGLLGGTNTGGAISHYKDPEPVTAMRQSAKDKLKTTGPLPFPMPQGSQKQMEAILPDYAKPERESGLIMFNYTDPSLPEDSVSGGVAGKRKRPRTSRTSFQPVSQ